MENQNNWQSKKARKKQEKQALEILVKQIKFDFDGIEDFIRKNREWHEVAQNYFCGEYDKYNNESNEDKLERYYSQANSFTNRLRHLHTNYDHVLNSMSYTEKKRFYKEIKFSVNSRIESMIADTSRIQREIDIERREQAKEELLEIKPKILVFQEQLNKLKNELFLIAEKQKKCTAHKYFSEVFLLEEKIALENRRLKINRGFENTFVKPFLNALLEVFFMSFLFTIVVGPFIGFLFVVEKNSPSHNINFLLSLFWIVFFFGSAYRFIEVLRCYYEIVFNNAKILKQTQKYNEQLKIIKHRWKKQSNYQLIEQKYQLISKEKLVKEKEISDINRDYKMLLKRKTLLAKYDDET